MPPARVHTARALDQPISLPLSEALRILQLGAMNDELGLMPWGSNYTFLVNIQLQDEKLLAIYKPRSGERPLWDFPDGTLCNRETAAYLTSNALGWRLTPPTILRGGTRGPGSAQLFISHDPDEHYFTFDKQSLQPQLQRIAIFDAIINNADRKAGHCLLDDDSQLWTIDHGLTFNIRQKLRTVIWDYAGMTIPTPLLKDIRSLSQQLADHDSQYRRAIKDLLSRGEIRMLNNRVHHLLTHRLFPLPGPGPNQPWPPV